MRLLISLLFLFFLAAGLILTLLEPNAVLTRYAQIAFVVLVAVNVLDRAFGLFKRRPRSKTPPSQVGELERLYFRCVRELLNDAPDLLQVINDLQRILSIDPHYKNAQHYLNRAILMRAQGETNPNGSISRPRSYDEFMKLQDQLIDPNPATRKAVVMELIQYGEMAVDPLIALLMDDDADVRIHAATALGWVGGREAVQPLLVALQDEDTYVRRYAARALCWVVDETAIDALIDSLNDPDNYVRQYCARALGWSQDRRSIAPLLELLSIEQNNDVREYAYIALDDLGEPNVRVERPLEVAE
ncbi:MAG: HEAT repeat domain-containing protein [Anaerolineae bacterium]|nr:HEAT repeat domain-containing protein [Anaerolineae bacterium]